MTENLKSMIIEAMKPNSGVISEKTWLQYLMGVPPIEDFRKLNRAFFYKDPQASYKRTSLVGMDIRLLVGNCLFFFLMDLTFRNTAMSLFLTYAFEGFLRYLRNSYGEDNISKKTLIDERFLI